MGESVLMRFDKDEIKENLSIDQIQDLVADIGGEPQRRGNMLMCKTICHGGDSHKLYYYDNTKLFRCYTECGDVFDIFQLLIKVHRLNKEDWTLYNAMSFVANFFSLDFEGDFSEEFKSLPDWQIFKKWDKNNLTTQAQKRVELNIFSKDILKNFPQPRYLNWEREGITKAICDAKEIHYNPNSQGIIVPHYNIDDDLVGIRERTLLEENEIYGKYRPAVINGKMYNHPLGFNLYNLNWSKNNIKAMKTAIVFEGEKSCLQFASFFGKENDISVAVCGSNLISYQVELLKKLGVSEIIIAFDKQFKKVGDEEWKAWSKKMYGLHDKYGKDIQISFLFDKFDLLEYKDSPTDKGKDIFLELFNRKIQI